MKNLSLLNHYQYTDITNYSTILRKQSRTLFFPIRSQHKLGRWRSIKYDYSNSNILHINYKRKNLLYVVYIGGELSSLTNKTDYKTIRWMIQSRCIHIHVIVSGV